MLKKRNVFFHKLIIKILFQLSNQIYSDWKKIGLVLAFKNIFAVSCFGIVADKGFWGDCFGRLC